MEYYILPHCSIAKIPKAYSAPIAKAVVEKYFGYELDCVTEVSVYPKEEFLELHPHIYKNLAKIETKPINQSFLLMREPVERFIESFNLGWYDSVKEALDNAHKDPYFMSQNTWATKDTKYFTLKQEKEFCTEAKLDYPLIGQSSKKFPRLSQEDEKLVQAYYKKDIEIYKKIK